MSYVYEKITVHHPKQNYIQFKKNYMSSFMPTFERILFETFSQVFLSLQKRNDKVMSRQVDDRIDLIDSESLLLQEKIDRLQLKRKKLLLAASQPTKFKKNYMSSFMPTFERILFETFSQVFLSLQKRNDKVMSRQVDDRLSNIHRQVIHSESGADESHGFAKVLSAKYRLMEINNCIEIKTYNTQLSHENALDIIQGGSYDVVVDS